MKAPRPSRPSSSDATSPVSAPSPEPAAPELRWLKVLGHQVRVSVRPGTEPGPPLLLCNGIGASLDLLQPFVDALDPRIEVVRFDVPGAGGSPMPKVPYTFATLAWLVATLVVRL